MMTITRNKFIVTWTIYLLFLLSLNDGYLFFKKYNSYRVSLYSSNINYNDDNEFFSSNDGNIKVIKNDDDSSFFWDNNANLVTSNNKYDNNIDKKQEFIKTDSNNNSNTTTATTTKTTTTTTTTTKTTTNNNNNNNNNNNKISINDILAQYETFNKLVLDGPSQSFDSSNAAFIHKAALFLLIQSDIQNPDDNENSEMKYFPESYIHAIYYIEDIIQTLENNENPISSTVKIIYKKEGIKTFVKSMLLSSSNMERKMNISQMMTAYEIVAIKRKVERCISLIMTLLICQRSCKNTNLEEDLIYFSKVIMEKTAIHDRHLALLIFCRGILAPTTSRKDFHETGDVQYVCRSPFPTFKNSFRTSMSKAGVKQPSIAARILYPFASTALRCYAILSGNAINEEVSCTMTDLQFSLFVKSCIDCDQMEGKLNGFVEEADEIFASLRRWFCDILALHFIAEDSVARKEILPEEIRRNTIAMELLSTDRVFTEGKKRDRSAYMSLMAEIGKYLDLMMTIPKSEQIKGSELFLNLKRFLATVSAIRGLPSAHRLRKKFEYKLKLNYLSPNSIQTSAGNVKTYLYKSSKLNSDDDDDFFAPTQKLNHFYKFNNKESDDELFAPVQAKKGFGKEIKQSVKDDSDEFWITSTKKELEPSETYTKETLLEVIDTTLLQVIADTLKVNEDSIIKNEAVKFEIAEVFSTWRKPQLLLDYYRMHSSSQDLQIVFRRFLKALFGITDETFDDIRYRDIGNKFHFDRLPVELVKQWVEGKSMKGKLLPGYNDAQSFFMLGEDSNTCMSIRARQKGTNRGLLSFLLHGNARIVGVKDKSGKLLARAVTRLLIDEKTNRPVLYVETPYGGTDDHSYLDVYDQAAELGRLLRIPVVYADAPKPSLYIMGPEESAGAMEESPIDNDYYGEKEFIQYYDVKIPDNLINITDYTLLSPYVWIDGIKSPKIDKYVFGRTPILIKRNVDQEFVVLGGRPANFIESTDYFYNDAKLNSKQDIKNENNLFNNLHGEFNEDFLFEKRIQNKPKRSLPVFKSVKKGLTSVQSRLFFRQKKLIDQKISLEKEKEKFTNRDNENDNKNNNNTNANSSDDDDDYFFE